LVRKHAPVKGAQFIATGSTKFDDVGYSNKFRY